MGCILLVLAIISLYVMSIAADVADIKILLKDIARRADDGK